MNLIAHRGHWNRDPRRQNSPEAVRDAFNAGWGVEVDLYVARRSEAGTLWVGHSEDERSWRFSEWLFKTPDIPHLPLLIDIKTAGIKERPLSQMSCFDNAYIFDHELIDPDLPQRFPEGRYLARCTSPADFDAALTAPWAAGVWLDQPEANWVTPDVLLTCLQAGRVPFIVSPELHRRPVDLAAWREWDVEGAWVCTNLPQLAAALATEEALRPSEPWWDVRG